MSRSPSHDGCPYGPDGNLYPPQPEPPFAPGADPDRDALFEALSVALHAVPDPVASAVAGLSAADVRAVLEALPIPYRVSALRPLGMKLTPRKVGAAMAADVLKRLRRAGGHELRHAAGALGWVVASDMMMVATGHPEFAEFAADKVNGWPPAVARTGLWANGMSSALGARVWVWAATQPWFASDGASAAELEAVAAAAQALVDATPDFHFSPNSDEADGDDGSDLVVDKFLADLLDSDETASPAEGSDAGSEVGADATTPAGLDELAAEVAALDAALREAAAIASAAAAALGAGQPPAMVDLAALIATRVEFDQLAGRLAVAGLDFAGDSTTGMAAAVVTAKATVRQAAGDEPVRDGLARVIVLRAPEGQDALADLLDGATVRALELLAGAPWSPAEREEARALTALADLAADGVSASDVFALQGKLVAARPDLVMLAISAAALTALPAEAAAKGSESGVEDIAAKASEPAVEDTAVEGIAVEDSEPAEEPAPAPAEQVAPVEATPGPATPPTVAAKDSSRRWPHRPANVDNAEQVSEAASPSAEPEADVAGAVTDLVGAGRHALAAALTAASGQTLLDGLDVDVLTVSALAGAVRGSASPTATELRTQIANLDSTRIQTDTTSLLLATTALLRTALVTGEPTAGAILVELEPHLEPHLGKLASEVGRRALQGVLLDAPPLTTIADADAAEAAMTQARQDATRLLGPRKLRFKRASDIANGWFAPDGIIGAALSVVAEDNRRRADIVAEALKLLTDQAEMSDEIDARDRELRSGSSNPLQGPGRGDLLKACAEAVGPLAAWTEAAASLSRTARSAPWSTTEVAQMRAAVLENAPQALAALKTAAASTDRIAAAAASAAAASLAQTVALLAGQAELSALELSPADALGLDVLHVAGARVDPSTAAVTMPSGVTDIELVAAAARSWDDALRQHVAGENFSAAHHLVAADEAKMLTETGGEPPQLSSAVVAQVATSETSARTELDGARADLGAALRTARANNQITEEQDAELTALLKDTKREGADLAEVRATLGSIGATLPHYSQRATTRLSDRLERAGAEDGVTEADIARVRAFIEHGDLATAEELIYLLETNEELPSPRQHNDLALFFPAVPKALPSGITTELVNVARRAGIDSRCPALDFSGLSADQAQLNATALESWVELGATPPAERLRVSVAALLLPALRMVGIEGKKVDQLTDLPRGRDRRFVDIRDVTINGKAMVPAFGSKLGDRRRVMLAWGQPSAQTLMSYVDQDPSAEPLIVAYLGTMSPQVRTDLAVRALRTDASVVVLDDAALAYLAARGARLMDATMRVLLPFANVNPYIRQKRGLVAPEMFYGRDEERRQVLDPDGTQIIYGGRGLGKSALLRDAEAKFATQGQGGEQLALYLSLDDIGGAGPRRADAVWDSLLEHLIDLKVITAKRSGRGSRSPHGQVVTGITSWLKERPSRRLLILLDESDRFFESDAPTFVETSNLRNLGVATNSRAKFVFAGLHSVQRFTKVAGNGPFSHLAQRPTVIGPLKPQFALNLLTSPMAALGYEFEEQDLVNRVLAHCSYQPFLLQMFGHRLVERMHEQRAAEGATAPYMVTRADIEAVQGNADLREDISNAFRETLHLDPRYNVIANVMAKHAHEFGLDARLSDSELREECLGWWPAGFATLDVEAFRSYLSEMVGLGVLARNPDGRGWRLRGPSVLSMVGLPSEVDNQLLGAETESLRQEFVALETRIELADGRWSPLTAAQLDDVLGDHSNQVRVILGSEATGIDMAAAGVRAATDIGARFTIPAIPSRSAFAAELTGGEPGTRRVVLSDLRANTAEVCLSSLDSAIAFAPDRAGVTRSVALVAGAGQMGFWREVFSRQDDTLALGTVALRRYDERTLKVWTMLAEKFRTPARAARLLAVTGGWPVLVERAAQQAGTASLELSTLTKLEAHLATAAGAAELVDLVGVCAEEELARAYNDLVDVLGDGEADLGDLHAAVSDATSDPEGVVACLRALGVFNADESGTFRLEPVLAAAWKQRF
jgi:hypothetical protein